MIVSRWLIFLLLAHALISVAWSASSSDESSAQQITCIDLIKQQTAAFVSEDWLELERIAGRFAKTCKNVLDQEHYSYAYEYIAIANVKLGNAKKALAASDSCIDISYSNSGCHLQKIEALIQLKRLADAKASLDKAERLIKHLIEIKERDRRNVRTSHDKELFEASLMLLNGQQSYVSTIRNRYFSQ